MRRSNSEFFDYEKNLSNLLNRKERIDIYISPNKRFRKRSEDEKFIKFDREKEKYIFMNKIKAYDIRKTESFTHREGKKNFYNKRSNDTELIISDMDPRNESYENHFLNNGKRNRYNSKSVKNVIRFSSIKRKLNKSKKKKSYFCK